MEAPILSGQDGRPPARILTRRDPRAERATALARRGAMVVRSREAALDQLVCACGTERYGLPLTAVAQVLPMRACTPMPGAVPALLGLIALSGRIVGVLGLARALGRPETAAAGDGGHLVVLRDGALQSLGQPHARPHSGPVAQPYAHPLALAVDRVLGIAAAPSSAAAADGTDPDGLGNVAASGYAPAATADGRPDFVVLDLPRLLRGALP